MFCQNCGTQNADNSAFCSKCGTPLSAAAQQPAQQPVQAPVQQPMQQPVYAAPAQHPMQQPVYAAPVQQPYAAPAKQSMGKGVLAAIIASIVVILAAVAVLLVVLLGGDDNSSGKKNDADGGKVTTQKNNKNDKNNDDDDDNDGFDLDLNGDDDDGYSANGRPSTTQNADSPSIEARPMQNSPEDIANVIVYTLETYDMEVLIDSIPREVMDYIVAEYGLSSVREWQRMMEASGEEERDAMAESGASRWCYYAGEWDVEAEINEIRSFYAEAFDLKVDDAKIVAIESAYEYYENGYWQTDYDTEEFYVVLIDGIWYLEGLDTFC